MSQNSTKGTQGAPILDESATQGDMDAKREMARQLMEGDGVDKDEAKAVSLLEDCVAHGDADAMVMLAKCCALGRGIGYNAERAKALLLEAVAVEEGGFEAYPLIDLINEWKWEECIYLDSLQKCFFQ